MNIGKNPVVAIAAATILSATIYATPAKAYAAVETDSDEQAQLNDVVEYDEDGNPIEKPGDPTTTNDDEEGLTKETLTGDDTDDKKESAETPSNTQTPAETLAEPKGEDDGTSESAGDDVIGEGEGEADEDIATATIVETADASVTYRVHVQNIGTMGAVVDSTTNSTTNAIAGTSGRSLRVEALWISVNSTAEIKANYAVHVQNIGWMGDTAQGAMAGTTGQSKAIEAIQVWLSGSDASKYHIWYRVHVQNYGWMDWTCDGGLSGTAGLGLRVEALQIKLVKADDEQTKRTEYTAPRATPASNQPAPFYGDILVETHVQNIGWQGAVRDAGTAGTTGRSLRMEALKIYLGGWGVNRGASTYQGNIWYNAHVQNVGWQKSTNPNSYTSWFHDGQVAGTTGKSQRVEAIQMKLSGNIANNYDLYYRTHVQNIGWMGWASEGEMSGTEGMSRRVEAIQIRLMPEGSKPWGGDSATSVTFVKPASVGYQAYQNGSWRYSSNGGAAGITGRSLAVSGVKVNLVGGAPGGNIVYRVSGVNGSWQDYVSSNALAGTEGGARLQAIQMHLTGDAAGLFDVYYRVHIQNAGWLGWAKNDQTAGSVNMGLQVESIEVQVVPKGDAAPGNTYGHQYGADGWRYENGHWWWYSDGARANFDNNLAENGRDLGNYDVVYEAWQRAQKYDSPTNQLVINNYRECYTTVFQGSKGNWYPIFGWNHNNGSNAVHADYHDGTSVITSGNWLLGQYSDPAHGVPERAVRHQTEDWYVNIMGGFAYHSSYGERLGVHNSHNCIRLAYNNAKWMYYNLKARSRILMY